MAVAEAVRAARVVGDVAADGAGRLAGGVGRVEELLCRASARQIDVDDSRLDSREAVFDVELQHVAHASGSDNHAAFDRRRATGKPGVVLVTSGPGATNAITGIATAYMDSIPMVVITGQVATPLIGNDAFQEVDIVGISRPCVKHNFLVKDVKDLAVTLKKAFYIANSGRPGPVVVDIPKDVTAAKAHYEYPQSVAIRSYNPVSKPHSGQVRKAVNMLLRARRPMIYTGGGITVLSDPLSEWKESCNKQRTMLKLLGEFL